MNKMGFVYIMTNKNRTTLYIGVTNDLCRRIYEHKNHLIKNSFTDKYNLEYCIYYEEFPYFDLAIQREKELKKWNRQKKEDLINKKNPGWKVLVTERGFVREKVSFSQQVNDLMNELKQNGEIPPVSLRKNKCHSEQSEETNEIPPCGRNDERLHGLNGESGGGFAATTLSPLSSLEAAVISSKARNLNNIASKVISSKARNITTCSNEPAISNGTQWSEESQLKTKNQPQ